MLIQLFKACHKMICKLHDTFLAWALSEFKTNDQTILFRARVLAYTYGVSEGLMIIVALVQLTARLFGFPFIYTLSMSYLVTMLLLFFSFYLMKRGYFTLSALIMAVIGLFAQFTFSWKYGGLLLFYIRYVSTPSFELCASFEERFCVDSSIFKEDLLPFKSYLSYLKQKEF
jgi:hypothetical protein